MITKDERRTAEIRRIREIFVPELVLRLHQELMVSRHLFPGYVIVLPADLPYLTASDVTVINHESLSLHILLSIVLAHAIHEPRDSIHDVLYYLLIRLVCNCSPFSPHATVLSAMCGLILSLCWHPSSGRSLAVSPNRCPLIFHQLILNPFGPAWLMRNHGRLGTSFGIPYPYRNPHTFTQQKHQARIPYINRPCRRALPAIP